MKKIIWISVIVLTLLTIFTSCQKDQKDPTASFTVSSTSVNVGENFSFTNTSIDADSYEWDFGDGNNSSIKNPVHAYSTAGKYTVSLKVTNSYGFDTETKNNYITVTIESGTLTDSRDGRIYNTVKIGNQWWMAENLNYYTNSSSWCYDNNLSNCNTYGRLYDWETACNSCPFGWHLPTDAEWSTLTSYLGGEGIAGGKMKETGMEHWYLPNTGATNESSFTTLPGGYLRTDGLFAGLGYSAIFWSATVNNSSFAWDRILEYDYATVYRNYYSKIGGFSVRCVKD